MTYLSKPKRRQGECWYWTVKVRLPDGQLVSGRLARKPIVSRRADTPSNVMTEALLDLAGGGIVLGRFVHAADDAVTTVTRNWMRVGRSLRAAARKIAADGPKPSGKAGITGSGQ